MKPTLLLVGVIVVCCSELGLTVDWLPDINAFFADYSEKWRTQQFEQLVQDHYLCDAIVLGRRGEKMTGCTAILKAYLDYYDAGFTAIEFYGIEELSAGDNTVVAYLKYAKWC